MDGTLYDLDGDSCGYRNSSLENKVLINATKLIEEIEGCTQDVALQIRTNGLLDQRGLSYFLSEKYTITRKDYFEKVWNINPKQIIKVSKTTKTILTKLKDEYKKLILLTSAPKIWQENVIKFLKIENIFEEIYTAEDYSKKEEVFKMISDSYLGRAIISIGDQEKTDIVPATKYGITGMLINGPKDLERLI